ncbi:MAG: phosphoglycerate kinase [Acidobacteriota bacterium]
MNKKTLEDLPRGVSRVLLRVDFNVPLKGIHILDRRRIQATLPTLRALTRAGHAVVCLSHLGRPDGAPKAGLSLRPVASALEEMLQDHAVRFIPQCTGRQVQEAAAALKRGQILVLENLRFHPGEEKADPEFAAALAGLASAYVNDAFGTAHRAHASTTTVTRFLSPSVAGILMEKEIRALGRITLEIQRPYAAVLGGAKISSKIEIIDQLLDRVDRLLIGGAMAYTFLSAMGTGIDSSLVELDCLGVARQLLKKARARKIQILLPVDHRAEGDPTGPPSILIDSVDIPRAQTACDIGPKTVAAFSAALESAGTVFWNGPMGVFERPPFAQGTRYMAQAIARCPGFTLLGGGETAAAVRSFGLEDKFDHISTGGGATLEFLAGHTLPGLEALDDKKES